MRYIFFLLVSLISVQAGAMMRPVYMPQRISTVVRIQPMLKRSFSCNPGSAQCLICDAHYRAARKTMEFIALSQYYSFLESDTSITERQRAVIKQITCCDYVKIYLEEELDVQELEMNSQRKLSARIKKAMKKSKG